MERPLLPDGKPAASLSHYLRDERSHSDCQLCAQPRISGSKLRSNSRFLTIASQNAAISFSVSGFVSCCFRSFASTSLLASSRVVLRTTSCSRIRKPRSVTERRRRVRPRPPKQQPLGIGARRRRFAARRHSSVVFCRSRMPAVGYFNLQTLRAFGPNLGPKQQRTARHALTLTVIIIGGNV